MGARPSNTFSGIYFAFFGDEGSAKAAPQAIDALTQVELTGYANTARMRLGELIGGSAGQLEVKAGHEASFAQAFAIPNVFHASTHLTFAEQQRLRSEKTTSYAHLTEHYRQLYHMQNVLGLLQWDMSTMMPKGSAQARAEQVTVMNSACHKLQTNPAVADWLSAAENESLSNWETANLREMARDYRQATALPADLVEALSNAISQCEITWLKARPANDFNELRPHLERVFELTRQKAQVLADASGLSSYDALLDLYEPDCTSAEIDSLFTELTEFLPNLVSEIIDHQRTKGPILKPSGPFDIDIQRHIGQKLMANLGFDFDHGRLDVSAHPFCGGSPDDIRITTRYTDQDFSQSIMGVIHETGHALYERGLPASFRGQPVGRARSMGIHESQSLLMEMQACRSPQFISYLAPS